MNSFTANSYFWWDANLYGSLTTQSEMLSVTYSQEQNYGWNTALYIGDSIFPSNQYPGPPQNLWLYPNDYDITHQQIWDFYIDMATGQGTHYFVFLWSCGSANFIGAGQPTQYGQAWGMAYCWTKKDGGMISSDGYGNPWGSATFIGFQYGSPNLDQKDPNYPNGGTYSTFLQRFYYWAVQQHRPINDALNRAAQDISGNPQATLQSLKLKTGYYVQGLWSYIRVFGNGNMVIPY
jgi:hypothetical protein